MRESGSGSVRVWISFIVTTEDSASRVRNLEKGVTAVEQTRGKSSGKVGRLFKGAGWLLSLALLLIHPAPGLAADVRYIYDDLNRLIGVVDPSGQTATYSYDSVGNILSITRYSSAQVSIIGFSPGTGPVGATVTISGTGFSPTPSQNTVTFNGVTASVASSTTTQIVTAVPAGATTGQIGVTAPGGSATSIAVFTVTAASGPPTITGFTPTIGTAGTPVTITGTNYDTTVANDKVKLNRSFAQVTSAAPTTLVAPVPASTGSGRLTVSTLQGTAVSTEDFFIPPAPFTAADVEATGRITDGGPGKPVTITTAGKIGLVVFDGAAGQRVSVSLSNVTLAFSWVRLYDPFGALVTTVSVGTSGGALNATLPSEGTYTLQVDPQGTNTGSLTLTLATPDLNVTTFTAPASATTQQSLGLSWTVTNPGTGAVQPTWSDYVYLSTDPVYNTGDTLVTSQSIATALAAGGSYTKTPTVTVPNVPAGNYYLILRVDHFNSRYEISETNNERVVPITITTPDLAATTFTAPASATTQQSISLSWTVTNQGTGTTQVPSWSDYMYLSTDAVYNTGDTFVTLQGATTPLASGASYTRTPTVTVPGVPAGNYYLILRVDHNSTLYEATEANNTQAIPITITTPDLTPTAFTAPASATTGQAIGLSWTVTNQGTGAAQPSWLDYVYLSTDAVYNTGDTFVTSQGTSAALGPGGSYSKTPTITVPSVPAGNYYLILRVDHLNGRYEANETNNTQAIPITISLP